MINILSFQLILFTNCITMQKVNVVTANQRRKFCLSSHGRKDSVCQKKQIMSAQLFMINLNLTLRISTKMIRLFQVLICYVLYSFATFYTFCGIALTQLLLQTGEVKSVIKKSLAFMFTDNAGKSTATLLSKNFSLGDGNILRVGSSKGIF